MSVVHVQIYVCCEILIGREIISMDHTALLRALIVVIGLSSYGVQASDPELTVDFAAPPGIDGSFFRSVRLENVTIESPNLATVTPINQFNFPALFGLGISSALVQYPAGALNLPHTHPRGTELLFLIEGSLDVGIVDTTSKLFTASINPGDLYVFPKGLVHFQINRGDTRAKAVVSFSSSNPGTVKLPINLFKTDIPDDVLMKSFGVGKAVLTSLKNAEVS
ncbi:hypothetical protein Mapa_002486 [Marchantia paleacea]|nr:hypothetical protein Mapa_002486 [Marchantia paleacea]